MGGTTNRKGTEPKNDDFPTQETSTGREEQQQRKKLLCGEQPSFYTTTQEFEFRLISGIASQIPK